MWNKNQNCARVFQFSTGNWVSKRTVFGSYWGVNLFDGIGQLQESTSGVQQQCVIGSATARRSEYFTGANGRWRRETNVVFGKLQVKRFKGFQESAAVRAFDQPTLHYGITKGKWSPQFLSFELVSLNFFNFCRKTQDLSDIKKERINFFFFSIKENGFLGSFRWRGLGFSSEIKQPSIRALPKE